MSGVYGSRNTGETVMCWFRTCLFLSLSISYTKCVNLETTKPTTEPFNRTDKAKQNQLLLENVLLDHFLMVILHLFSKRYKMMLFTNFSWFLLNFRTTLILLKLPHAIHRNMKNFGRLKKFNTYFVFTDFRMDSVQMWECWSSSLWTHISRPPTW